MSGLDVYAASFLDPFDGTISQPKILDGSVDRSSGLKFRQTGNITLDATGGDNLIILHPGLSNGMSWNSPGGTSFPNSHTAYPTHLGTTANRSNLRKARIVSQGVKFSLLNSSDDNEGYWEAIRVPLDFFALSDTTSPNGEDYRVVPGGLWNNFASYNTFQTGRLRDIHRYLFKLNSVAPDHPFVDILTSGATPTPDQCMDKNFDMIVIRIVGRIDAVTPSMIQYDLISNQEVVYKDDTVMARLATLNKMVPNIDILMDRTRFILPAIQIA